MGIDMAIKLRSIYFKNWKCYKNQKLDFNLNNSKKIWIVFGQNGFGKTSILEAIQWCLYGSNFLAPSQLLECFNRVAINENPELDLVVQVTFECDCSIYDISRTAHRKVGEQRPYAEPEEPLFLKNGINQSDVRAHIAELLPNASKEFFLFDGVEIKRYAQRIHTEETHEAIERILGIPELRNLRHDAESATKKFKNKLNQSEADNDKYKQLNNQLQNVREKIDNKREQYERVEQEYNEAVEIYESSQERANQINSLRGKLDKLKELESEQEDLNNKLNKAKNKIKTAYKKASIPLLLGLVQEVADEIDSSITTTPQRSGSVAQLEGLLQADTCLCGRCIDESVRQHIRERIKQNNKTNFSQDALQKKDLRDDKELRDDLVALSRFNPPNFNQFLSDRDRLDEEIEEVRQAKDRLKKQTEGINEQEAREMLTKVGEAKQQSQQKQSERENLTREIESLRQEEEKLYRETEELLGYGKETATLAQQMKLARSLVHAAEELIEWRTEECKETIEKRTSEIHRCVTNKPKEYTGIKIKDNYTLEITTVSGDVLNPETLSAGEKEALAFAFIAGLNLASGRAAPLIMDTPFGHLDTGHQKNLVNSLPDLPSQVVVLATDRDFPDDLLQGIRDDVAEIFHIRRLSATEDASVVEVEE
ncbi:MAG: chromosome segregation protein SMC [Cyanobacteria bacterium QS_8_48_54]|nr:MAG: chromosome segregation protein SMC [Cyanobacteria bacterium QS_8_48_54]